MCRQHQRNSYDVVFHEHKRAAAVFFLAILATIDARMSVDEASYRRRHDRLSGRRRRRRRRLLSADDITSAPRRDQVTDRQQGGSVARPAG